MRLRPLSSFLFRRAVPCGKPNFPLDFFEEMISLDFDFFLGANFFYGRNARQLLFRLVFGSQIRVFGTVLSSVSNFFTGIASRI